MANKVVWLYDRRWRVARGHFLTENPLCVYCEEEGRITPATEVDHIKPHKGDKTLFWDIDNWQGLCANHHRSTKQHEERTGNRKPAFNANGYPSRPNRHWS